MTCYLRDFKFSWDLIYTWMKIHMEDQGGSNLISSQHAKTTDWTTEIADNGRKSWTLLTSMVIPFCRTDVFDPPFRWPFLCLLEVGWGIAPTLANGMMLRAFSPRRGGKWNKWGRSLLIKEDDACECMCGAISFATRPIVAVTRRSREDGVSSVGFFGLGTLYRGIRM